jgi:hypothetical protein
VKRQNPESVDEIFFALTLSHNNMTRTVLLIFLLILNIYTIFVTRLLLISYPCDTGMVGMMGVAAVTKKRGGYTNTKLHGMMAWAGLILSGGGMYVIYQHKESMGKNHYTTYHSWGESISADGYFTRY